MSELLNALNPNAVQNRTRTRTASQNPQNNHVQQPTQQVAHSSPGPAHNYVPHRSELEGAIVEPPPVPAHVVAPPPQPAPVAPPQAAPTTTDQLTQILQMLANNQKQADEERERRLKWEQEQEAKYSQRETEIQKTFTTMQERITELSELVTTHSSRPTTNTSGVSTPASFHAPIFPTLEQPYVPPPDTPISSAAPSPYAPSPYAPSPYAPSPPFVQGSSRHPIPMHPPSMPVTPLTAFSPVPVMAAHIPAPLPHTPHIPPHPSPHMHAYPYPYPYPPLHPQPYPIPDMSTSPTASFPATPVNYPPSAASPPSASGSQPNNRKRPAGADEEENISERPKSPRNDRPAKRVNGHDNRLLTIHAAMRAQILRSMALKSDKNLPDGHVEGQPLQDDQPVRFVWDKTPKASSHNAAMKIRVIKELRQNRDQYKDIQDSEFNDKTLESAFEQVFSTFRSKFKTQRDDVVAANAKQREETKATKSRRVRRKKAKLDSRKDMRGKLEAFSHTTFEPALQPECMSSDESCTERVESTGPGGSRTKVQILKTHGLPWRSNRLIKFYSILDSSQTLDQDKSTKSRRAPQRKERLPGPDKEDYKLPPNGIAGWMISRRWLKGTRQEQPEWVAAVEQYASASPGFDWEQFDMLGDATDEESEPEQPIPRSGESSIAHALAPAATG